MAPEYVWLIPGFPLAAAAATALLPRKQRKWSSTLAIAAMSAALISALVAFSAVLSWWKDGEPIRRVFNFRWFQVGDAWVHLGWMIDPLSAVMVVMICIVSLLVFIYSVGYMHDDANFTRFFCFLSLFAAAMLGLVLANSLLLLFICWELVGLASYLLIGFWYQKPSAAAAAKKAFIVTRLGDLSLLLGLVWLYGQCGTVLFYDAGAGCLETSAINQLVNAATWWGLAVSTVIGLLIFGGAVGKSGQVPLHVWLPDAMEGPTPVSALIHAATMVAAGVFLMARVYPLLSAQPTGVVGVSGTLEVIAWVGAITALFAATIAVAQTDIKRILAYSTVSQLGFMMLGLGTGGVAVGIFHLITHAFFKALLFLGAGSVIHGMHEEQDITRMGGLRNKMPVTFGTYAIGMLALSGFPLVFSGFWSKDAILHGAHEYSASHGPFYLGAMAALLTAFYMTRQMIYVFFGEPRTKQNSVHESPRVMTVPLMVLAGFAMVLGFVGTPVWPSFQSLLDGTTPKLDWAEIVAPGIAGMMLLSAALTFIGIGIGYVVYGRKASAVTGVDPLEARRPDIYAVIKRKYYLDEVYEWAAGGLNRKWAQVCDWFDRTIASGAVLPVGYFVLGLSWLSRVFDEFVVNLGFDQTCRGISEAGRKTALSHQGRVQGYLRMIGLGAGVVVLLLIGGCVRS